MRAALFHGPGKPITIEQVADPVPTGDDVVVKVHRCGICGSDVSGTVETSGSLPLGRFGHEWAGEVVEVGRNVGGVRVGDHISGLPSFVCGHCDGCRGGNLLLCQNKRYVVGGFGEYMVIPQATANPLPRSLSFADAALVEPMACGLHALRLAQMRGGERVLVIGGGAMALSVIYWARQLGAARIVALVRSPHRHGAVMGLGADAILGFGEDDLAKIAETLGGSPDIVGECVGKPGMLDLALQQVNVEGTVLSLGMCRHAEPVVPAFCTHKEVRLMFPVAYTAAEIAETTRAFDRGKVDPQIMVSETIALDDLPQTMAELWTGSRKKIKILVDPS